MRLATASSGNCVCVCVCLQAVLVPGPGSGLEQLEASKTQRPRAETKRHARLESMGRGANGHDSAGRQTQLESS